MYKVQVKAGVIKGEVIKGDRVALLKGIHEALTLAKGGTASKMVVMNDGKKEVRLYPAK